MARAGERARVCPEDFMAPPAMSDVARRDGPEHRPTTTSTGIKSTARLHLQVKRLPEDEGTHLRTRTRTRPGHT